MIRMVEQRTETDDKDADDKDGRVEAVRLITRMVEQRTGGCTSTSRGQARAQGRRQAAV